MNDEDVHEIKNIKIPLKIDGRHIAVEQDGKQDGPYSRCVPPVLEPIFHDDESTILIGEFLHEVGSVCNK